MTAPGPVLDALREIHRYLCTAERGALARYGVPEFHLAVRPVSPAAPPPPQQMEQITQAVRTLAGLGMLAMPDDADSREQHGFDADLDVEAAGSPRMMVRAVAMLL